MLFFLHVLAVHYPNFQISITSLPLFLSLLRYKTAFSYVPFIAYADSDPFTSLLFACTRIVHHAENLVAHARRELEMDVALGSVRVHHYDSS